MFILCIYISLLFWSVFSLIYISSIADTNQPIVLFMDGSKNYIAEALAQRYSVKKVFWEISQNSQGNICARVSFSIKFIKKEALAQVFSCEFWNIFKNIFFHRTPPVAASDIDIDETNTVETILLYKIFFFFTFSTELLFDA